MRSLKNLEKLGRTRLSPNFFLRDFLHSEVSEIERLGNFPEDDGLLVQAGEGLCQQVLEPIQATLGKVSIRSAYRSAEVNRIGNEKGYNCAANEYNHARHIWDIRDSDGHFGATACIVVNSFVDYYQETSDWTVLAWWLHDHIPAYREIMFYPNLAAFNINWYSGPVSERTIAAQMPDPATRKKGILTRTGWDNDQDDHREHYEPWLQSI